MKQRKLRHHCAAPSKVMCSSGHVSCKICRHIFQLQKKFSLPPPLLTHPPTFPSHFPLMQCSPGSLWAFGDLAKGKLNWVGRYIYILHGHFHVHLSHYLPHVVELASRYTPPTHWADLPGEVPKRARPEVVSYYRLLQRCPARPTWIVEGQKSHLTCTEPEASLWKMQKEKFKQTIQFSSCLIKNEGVFFLSEING